MDNPVLEIKAPPPEIQALVTQSDRLGAAVADMTIDSEASFQFADDFQFALRSEAQRIEEFRKRFITGPIDKLKAEQMAIWTPPVKARIEASDNVKRKMLDYRRAVQEEAQKQRLAAERIQRETQARLEEEARKRDAAAAKLKSEAGRRKAQEDADALRQAALLTPVNIAVSAPAPVSTASNVVEKWECEVQNPSEFLTWLALHPEWQNVVSFGKAAMNRLASQYKDSLAIPGVRIFAEESLRKKAAR